MYQGGHDATNYSENPFWLYSIEQYKKPGCAEFLLNAQDQYQLDINFLLFIGWLTMQKKIYRPSVKIECVHHWQTATVTPIRQLRRRAKHLSDEAFYQSLKQLELKAEQVQQTLLFRISQEWGRSERQGYEIFELGLQEYLANTPVLKEESWLQALYQHLQP